FACLPADYRLDDYDYDAQPGVEKHLIADLATLRFVDEAANVLFIGPPGVGKTILAVGLARAAAEAGHRVYFTTAADLAARAAKAPPQARWNTIHASAAGRRLQLIGEPAYRRAHEDGTAALFQLMNTRYLKGTITLTSPAGITT